MQRNEDISFMNLTAKRDKRLFAMLNAVSPYMYRRPHDLARFILLQKLNELIDEYGIDINEFSAQSA